RGSPLYKSSIGYADNSQFLRIGSWKVSKPHCVDQLEDGSVGANSEREGEDTDNGKRQVHPQDASPIADILQDRCKKASARLFSEGDGGGVDMLNALQSVGKASGVEFGHHSFVRGFLALSSSAEFFVAVSK